MDCFLNLQPGTFCEGNWCVISLQLFHFPPHRLGSTCMLSTVLHTEDTKTRPKRWEPPGNARHVNWWEREWWINEQKEGWIDGWIIDYHNPKDNDIQVLVRIFLDKVGKNGLEVLGWGSSLWMHRRGRVHGMVGDDYYVLSVPSTTFWDYSQRGG